MLRDDEAVGILFDELAERFADRPGGYTRIVQLPNVRLGDAGAQALIEFVGERDRVKSKKRAAPIVEDDPAPKAEEEAPADDEPKADADEQASSEAAESADAGDPEEKKDGE